MKKSILFLFICFLAAISHCAPKPNIIIVMTDDQGYGEFSFNGNPLINTPHIDMLASESIRLTDFHVAPMCTPTRGQLMTGMDAFRNGALNVSSGRTLLRPELKTIANIFAEADYRTGLFGKWHLGDNYPFRPEDRGFDEAIWFPSSHISSVPDYWNNDYFDDTYIHNGKREKFSGYCTDVFFREAIEWMKKQADEKKPFFSYIALNAAHGPHYVPDHYRTPVRKAVMENQDLLNKMPKGRQDALISFLAMGLNIDENMGLLERFLKENNLEDNTILVFLTDNGSTFGDSYYNAGMKGRKTQLWEGGHRVPCLIRWNNEALGSPRDIDTLTQVQDLLPTLADLAMIDGVPDDLDGVSLKPLFTGNTLKYEDRMLVINYSRMPTFKITYSDLNPAIPQKNGAAVLWKKWRYLENRELYNLSADPKQDNDVARQYPEVVEKLSRHLDSWWSGVEKDVLIPQRIIIGSDRENPMLVTACEWLDVFIDQQIQVRRGDRKNGVWHVTFAKSGKYSFKASRFPAESGLGMRDAVHREMNTDGEFQQGPAFQVKTVKLRIGKNVLKKSLQENDRFVLFETEVDAGDTTIQSWLLDEKGEEIAGAYYLIAERL